MSIKYNVMIQKEEEWYVAKCLDNNVASQGKTIEEALKNLKEALELYLQNEEIVQPKETYLTTLEVAIWVLNTQYYLQKKYEIAKGTLKSILEQADIELEEFLKYLKS